MTPLFIQLLQMGQTLEAEIAILLTFAGETELPDELVRALCMFHRDVIIDMNSNHNWECFKVKGTKITSLWCKYMNSDSATKEEEKTASPSRENVAQPLINLHSSASTVALSTVEPKEQVVTGNVTDTLTTHISKCTYALPIRCLSAKWYTCHWQVCGFVNVST